jgi:hypothetical protein
VSPYAQFAKAFYASEKVLGNQLIHDEHAKARTFALSAGCIEWLKYMFENVSAHTASIIAKVNFNYIVIKLAIN